MLLIKDVMVYKYEFGSYLGSDVTVRCCFGTAGGNKFFFDKTNALLHIFFLSLNKFNI